MIVVLDKNTDIPALKKQLNLKTSSKGFDAKEYSGALKTNSDPLVIQKQLRDEWK